MIVYYTKLTDVLLQLRLPFEIIDKVIKYINNINILIEFDKLTYYNYKKYIINNFKFDKTTCRLLVKRQEINLIKELIDDYKLTCVNSLLMMSLKTNYTELFIYLICNVSDRIDIDEWNQHFMRKFFSNINKSMFKIFIEYLSNFSDFSISMKILDYLQRLNKIDLIKIIIYSPKNYLIKRFIIINKIYNYRDGDCDILFKLMLDRKILKKLDLFRICIESLNCNAIKFLIDYKYNNISDNYCMMHLAIKYISYNHHDTKRKEIFDFLQSYNMQYTNFNYKFQHMQISLNV